MMMSMYGQAMCRAYSPPFVSAPSTWVSGPGCYVTGLRPSMVCGSGVGVQGLVGLSGEEAEAVAGGFGLDGL